MNLDISRLTDLGMIMNITDKISLSVLQKVLFVAKWDASAENPRVFELASNPNFSLLYYSLIDELVRGEPTHPKATSEWRRWQVIEDRPGQLARVRVWIERTAGWLDLTSGQRRELVLVLISPFVATAETIDELLSI